MARGEVTGRKLKTDRDIPRLGFRIPEFCRAFGISQDFYYRLQRAGLGPKTMKMGHVTIISVAAADDWRRVREAATATAE